MSVDRVTAPYGFLFVGLQHRMSGRRIINTWRTHCPSSPAVYELLSPLWRARNREIVCDLSSFRRIYHQNIYALDVFDALRCINCMIICIRSASRRNVLTSKHAKFGIADKKYSTPLLSAEKVSVRPNYTFYRIYSWVNWTTHFYSGI